MDYQRADRYRILIEAPVPCDFSHAGLEDGLDALNLYIQENNIETTNLTYLYLGLECDLLRAIDLSRTFYLHPSFREGYADCEWSLHKLDKDYRHLVYWSPGA